MNRYILLLIAFAACLFSQTQPVETFSWPAASGIYQVGYLANLNVGDSYVNVTNVGALNGADPAGRMCARFYVFDPNEEPVSCCACPITPNGLVSLSARNSLIANPLTPGVPNSVVVKVVFSSLTGSVCDASDGFASAVRGGVAWGTTLHSNTSTSPAVYQQTETPFVASELSITESVKLVNICGFIQTYASKFGLCRGCSAGAMGASASN